MLNEKNSNLERLCLLGLSLDEAKIYLELLREPSTHLRLSNVTSINRTKIYRIVDNLEKRSLIARRTDDRGTFLICADPTSLEATLLTLEEKMKQKREAFSHLLPDLQSLKHQNKPGFVVQTYAGDEGIKQMFWHELKTKGELLSLGGQNSHLVISHYWNEQHRARIVEAGYTTREIINSDIDFPVITKNKEFKKLYSYRQLSSNLIYFNEQIIIYNNTVSIYHWQENQKVGVEIISASYANVMRKIFEFLWEIAGNQNENKKLENDLTMRSK